MTIEVTGIRVGGLRFDPRKEHIVWQITSNLIGQRFDLRVLFDSKRESKTAPVRAFLEHQRADGSRSASDGSDVVKSGHVDVSFVLEAMQPITLSLEFDGATVFQEVFPVEPTPPERYVTGPS